VKILSLLLIFILSSCVVMKEEYFHPLAEGGKVEKESCRGQVGADNRLVYEFDNVSLRLNVWEYKGNTYLSVAFRVFETGTVIWPIQVVNVYADDRKVNFNPKSFARLRSKVGELVNKEYAAGITMDHSTIAEYETYHEYLTIPDKKSKEVKVELIKVIINGKEHSLTDMTFTKKEGVFLHPLNC
jgi:hypothetical protein